MSKRFLFLISFAWMMGFAFSSIASGEGEDPNLVGWWKFDTSDTGLDSSGKGYKGTATGDLTWVAEGSGYDGSGYLDFNGTDGCVDVNYVSGGAFLLRRYTVSMWFRRDAGTEEQTLISLFKPTGTNADHGMLLSLNRGWAGRVRYVHRFPFGQSSGVEIYSASDASCNIGEWHHIAAVVESDTSRILYVDGKQVSASSDAVGEFDEPLRLFIGGLRPGYLRAWNGGLDDVRIYNRPLSADEIQKLAVKPAEPAS